MASPMTFRRILCPVDFSACSRAALRYAAALARRQEGELTVLFVNDPELFREDYRRYLENRFRAEFGFDEVPVRVSFRKRQSVQPTL